MNPGPSADTVRLWKHRRGDRYVLITANVVGNPERGFEIEHYLGTGEFDTIGQAKRAGLRHLDRSDDFNIGAIRNGRLTAILWMGEIVDDEPEVVDGIADEIGPLLIDGYRRLDPDAPAPPLEGGDWGFVDDLDDGHVTEPSDPGDGAE